MVEWKHIDGEGLILGRMGSEVAKMLLRGKNVVITNSISVRISGNRRQILDKNLDYKKIKTRSNPKKGPFRVGIRPDRYIRKVIKQMLPKNERGKKAYANLHTFIIGIPETKKATYEKMEDIVFPEKYRANQLKHKSITVEDVCLHVGWNKGGML